MPDVTIQIQQLTDVYGLGQSTLRRYKNEDGVDIFDPLALGKYIAGKQRPPSGYVGQERSVKNMEALTKVEIERQRPEPRERKPANHDAGAGVGETLSRLEIAEGDLYDRWQLFEESEGNPTEAKRLHAAWNSTAKTLLDYDLKLDAARKEMGETVPFSLVKQLLAVVGTKMVHSATNQARTLWSSMRPLLKEDVHPDEFLGPFLDAARNSIIDANLEFREDPILKPVGAAFLEEIDKHLVVEEDAET